MVFPPPVPCLSTHIMKILHISFLLSLFVAAFFFHVFSCFNFFNPHLFILSFRFVSFSGLNLAHFQSRLLLFSRLEYHKQEKANLIFIITFLQGKKSIHLKSRYLFAGYVHANVDIISPGKVKLFIYLFIKIPDVLKRWIKTFCQTLALLALLACIAHERYYHFTFSENLGEVFG